MTRWEEMMVFYGQSHRNPVNIAVHVVGVPVIVCSVFIAAAWLKADVAGLTIHGSWLIAAAGLAYYFTVDKFFAAVIAPVMAALVLAANFLAELPFTSSALYAAGGFFGGYAAQFIGHAIEGRKPALFQSLWKAMVTAPLFVVAELCNLLGLRKELFTKVNAEIQKLDRAAA